MKSFDEMGLSPSLLKGIEELGFEVPTPIQAEVIPLVFESKSDVVGLAQTGTGKTAAFGLPIIDNIDIQKKSVQALILAPTRELCMQISKDLQNYSKFIKGLNVVPVYGGASIDTQIRALKRGGHIIVATPGRILDLIKRRAANVENIRTVVLDEADEMLNRGFREDLNKILEKTPDFKKTLLFSATMPKDVARIAKNYMDNPVEISVDRQNSGAENVKHIYYQVHARDRYLALKRIADINPNIYGIVFCRTRRETKEVANKLMHDEYNADAIHGDLSQPQRDEVMGRFRKRQLQILVATDVAARGLDVTDLTHIINYNLPDDSEVYTHRSGRTGRAGKSGISIAIIHTRETMKIRDIERISGITFSHEPVPSGKDICSKQLYALVDKIEKVQVDDHQIDPFLPNIYKKLEWLSREDLIKHFVSAEFNRFLDYYKNASDLNTHASKKDLRSSDRNTRGRKDKRKGAFTKLFINVGSQENLNPSRLMGLINESLGSRNVKVGKIEIMKNFSFFGIDEKMMSSVISAMNGQNFGGITLVVEASQDKSDKSEKSDKPTYSKGRSSKSRGDRNIWGGRKSGGKGRRSDKGDSGGRRR